MNSRTPQEDLLVLEALVDFHWRRRDVQPERAARAWVLATESLRVTVSDRSKMH